MAKRWVDQEAVLDDPVVQGFLPHSGWNSVTEAALRGLRMLAWPHLSDHRICAMVMEKSGVGEWSWDGEEIGQRLKEIMNPLPATKVKRDALSADSDDGSSGRHVDKLLAPFERRGR